MDWHTKTVYWDNTQRKRWQEVYDYLSGAGAKQFELPISDKTDIIDLVIADVDRNVEVDCTPVLRPEKKESNLCCESFYSSMDKDQFLAIVEKWGYTRKLATDFSLLSVPVIDMVTIESLERLAGPEVLSIGRGKFLNSAEKYLERIEQGNNALDLEEVTKVLHTLKGSSGTIGARQLSQASRMIEDQIDIEYNKSDLSKQLSLLYMLLEYFRYESKAWGKNSRNG